MAEDSLFVPDAEGWLPTGHSRGPWSADHLHGGPVAALIVRELEALEAPVPMRLARVTVELMRPVTLEPLAVQAHVVRPGAKVGLLEATMSRVRDGTVVAVARALRIRTAEVEFPDPSDEPPPELPPTADTMALVGADELTTFHGDAVEHRFARGMFGVPGAAFDWTRLKVPVVPGEDPTPWQRTAASADFGNGISSVVPFDGSSLFINPDLTVHLWREPVGDWVGLDASTRTSSTGIGMAESSLWDRQGRFGRSIQSLLLDRP